MRRARAWLPACALVAAACVGTSRPSRFYTLVPREARAWRAPERAAATVALGPIEIPDVLDRKQIVTRAGEHQLVLGEFDRWGGSLREDVARALGAELAERLAPRGIAVVPRRLALVTSAPDLRATVAIARFDGALGESVILSARWEVASAGAAGRVLAAGDRTLVEQVGAPGYDAFVAAMQRALRRLGVELADGVASAAAVAVAR